MEKSNKDHVCLAAAKILASWADQSIASASQVNVVQVGKDPQRDYKTSKFENFNKHLYPNYCQWCADNKITNNVLTLRQFKPALAEFFWNAHIDVRPCRVKNHVAYSGIAIKLKFYMTLGDGQPYYPGYFECEAISEHGARLMTAHALKGRWCGTYDSLEKLHPLDKIYRGIIDEDGAHPI